MTNRMNSSTDQDTMLKLTERCEQATGPDRELDGMIGAIVGCEFHSAEVVREYAHDDHAWGGKGPHWAGTANSLGVLKFTASLDAAMTLVPEGMIAAIFTDGTASVVPEGSDETAFSDATIYAATPALALCAAALRSRASQ